MHALEFLKNPKTHGVKPLYAAFGDDAYLRHEVVQAIVRQALGGASDDNPATRFDGSSASLAEVFDELRTLPFLAKRRVAIVDDAEKFVTAHRRELEAYSDRPSETGVLVLCPKLWPSSTKLAKVFAAKGLAIECKVPKDSELPGWLSSLAQSRHGVRLDGEAARLLVELVGAEVGILCSELDKLAIYVAGREVITHGDVAKMVGAGRVETIWRVLDAATTGQAARALHDLDRLMTSGEHPVGLLAAMSASLRKVHQAGQSRRLKVPLNEACREAGIPPFAVESTDRQHRHLGPTRVDRLPAMLLDTDLALKGGSQLAPRVVLERFLLQLARPRSD